MGGRVTCSRYEYLYSTADGRRRVRKPRVLDEDACHGHETSGDLTLQALPEPGADVVPRGRTTSLGRVAERLRRCQAGAVAIDWVTGDRTAGDDEGYLITRLDGRTLAADGLGECDEARHFSHRPTV